jgi:hypothetical protein
VSWLKKYNWILFTKELLRLHKFTANDFRNINSKFLRFLVYLEWTILMKNLNAPDLNDLEIVHPWKKTVKDCQLSNISNSLCSSQHNRCLLILYYRLSLKRVDNDDGKLSLFDELQWNIWVSLKKFILFKLLIENPLFWFAQAFKIIQQIQPLSLFWSIAE